MMKNWMITGCLLLAGSLFLAGCGSSGPTNVMDSSDDTALAEYEAALAEADKMAAGDADFED